MSFNLLRDGSVLFISDIDGSTTQLVPAGTPAATTDALYTAFQAVYSVAIPSQAPQIVALPTANPGITGAMFITANTLHISQGPSAAAVQIGATGPGGAVIL